MRAQQSRTFRFAVAAGWRLACALLAGTGLAGVAHGAEPEDVRGPDVTIIEEENRTVTEYRQNGYLRMIRVVPKVGKPYYLVPRDQTKGYEDLEEADTLLPNWVIVEF
ncbi:MAG: DUF2782 domain-containing protein [Pseudomonadales bacterium]|jgi:hypothetical protein